MNAGMTRSPPEMSRFSIRKNSRLSPADFAAWVSLEGLGFDLPGQEADQQAQAIDHHRSSACCEE